MDGDALTNNDKGGVGQAADNANNQPNPMNEQTDTTSQSLNNEPTDNETSKRTQVAEEEPSAANNCNDEGGAPKNDDDVGASDNNNEGLDKPPPTSMKKKQWTVKEQPKWRFVAVAKKTEGYSSTAAGSVIEGKF